MSLLINDNETFEVKVKYVLVADGIKYFEEDEKAPPEAISEWFKFKRPNWEETCEIMSYAMVPYNGTVVLNPYRFIDGKLKVLLTSWSLKDAKGNPLECNPVNIMKLNPSICEYLSSKLDVSSIPVLPAQADQDDAKDKATKSKSKKGKKQEMASMGPEPQKKFFEEEAKPSEAKLQEIQAMPTPPSAPESTTQ